VTHYEVLGVSPSATATELRQAYLRLARAHHPDRHAGASEAARTAAELRMRELNDAWHVLGHPERRRAYDASLSVRPRAAVVDPGAASTWQPFDTGPDAIDDRLDDSHRPPPRGGRLLAVVPGMVLAGGVLTLVVGAALGWRGLVALGAAGLLGGMALFVLASVSVVFESRRNDLDPRRR